MNNGYIYRIGSNTNIIGRPPMFYSSGALLDEVCRFASVYAVSKQDAQAIEKAGTAAGFKGTVWSQKLWVDLDNQEAAHQAQAFLKEQGYEHVVYSTGNRGCHIGIARSADPSHTLPAQDKLWVRENIPGADLSLYWHLHLIRLPGALHETTGLPKRLLYRVEGRELTLPLLAPDEAVSNSSPQGSSLSRESIFKVWAIADKLVYSGGSRHHHLVTLAKALAGEGKLNYEETLWLVQEVNLGFDEPKGKEEVESIVKWAHQG